MIIRHLTALLHRARCDRAVLIPMLDNVSDISDGAEPVLYSVLDREWAEAWYTPGRWA